MVSITAYKNVPVLVTGGCGFIGSHLVEALVASGALVTVLDDCSTGFFENIAHLEDKIEYVKGSIVEFETCYQSTKNIAIVFHLAAYVSVPGSLANPYECHTINSVGTMHLLEACRKANVHRFVFSSSAAVYGKKETMCVESMICAPESPYGTSKLMGELLCQQYARCFGLKTICLRYFNVYGERQNPIGAYAGVVAQFIYNMKHNLPITLFGDGTQTRDFIPVQQVVIANMRSALLDQKHMDGTAYNIATGRSINLLELIEILKKEYPQYTQELRYTAVRQGDIAYSAADCSAFQAILDTLQQQL